MDHRAKQRALASYSQPRSVGCQGKIVQAGQDRRTGAHWYTGVLTYGDDSPPLTYLPRVVQARRRAVGIERVGLSDPQGRGLPPTALVHRKACGRQLRRHAGGAPRGAEEVHAPTRVLRRAARVERCQAEGLPWQAGSLLQPSPPASQLRQTCRRRHCALIGDRQDDATCRFCARSRDAAGAGQVASSGRQLKGCTVLRLNARRAALASCEVVQRDDRRQARLEPRASVQEALPRRHGRPRRASAKRWRPFWLKIAYWEM